MSCPVADAGDFAHWYGENDLDDGDPGRLGPLDVLVLSAWCGLAGGLLEVGTSVVCKIFRATECMR